MVLAEQPGHAAEADADDRGGAIGEVSLEPRRERRVRPRLERGAEGEMREPIAPRGECSGFSSSGTEVMPLCPASSARQLASVVTPTGVVIPTPVTTTLRAGMARDRRGDARDIRAHVADRHKVRRLALVELRIELVADPEEELDDVERVRAQILDDAGLRLHLIGGLAQVIGNQLAHA
jgi:hypothetical protein